MEQIVLEEKESAPSSDQDVLRNEEPWNPVNETLLKKWEMDARKKASIHTECGHKYKLKSVVFGLPVSLLSISMSPISLMIGNTRDTEIIKAVMFLISGLLTGVNSYFKYGELSQTHFNYAGRYADVVELIETEFAKHRPFRTQADVFINKIQMTLSSLDKNAPAIKIN